MMPKDHILLKIDIGYSSWGKELEEMIVKLETTIIQVQKKK
jgi:hypothetical protein